MRKKIFITSALPYVNNQPHLGNVIGSLLSADVYARYCRRMNYDTTFICGTDEYGTCTEMAAQKQGCMPIDIVIENRAKHIAVYKFFNLKFDSFGHTHCKEHAELTQEFFKKTANYFSEQEVSMMFCNMCKQYLADRFLEGTCECGEKAHGDQCDGCGKTFGDPSELADLKCVICSNEPAPRTTTHLFLDLDKLQKHVKKLDTTRWSDNAKTIYEAWLKKGVRPRCMTRTLKHKWGVPVPLAGYDDKVFYVWFDAPIGYLTFLKAVKPLDWLKGATWVQFMGKDNVPFHSITFPSVLFAVKEFDENCGKIESNPEASLADLQNKDMKPVDKLCLDYEYVISATEYLTFNKQKFSKSKGIGIFGLDLVKKDVGDVTKWKFYLLKRRPEKKDADFNTSEFIQVVTNELIANIGNFINRTLKFVEKREVNVYGKIGHYLANKGCDRIESFISEADSIYKGYFVSMEKIELRNGLDKVLELGKAGNIFLQDMQQDKQNQEVGYAFAFCLIKMLAQTFEPFMPEAFAKLQEIINIKEVFYSNFKETYMQDVQNKTTGVIKKKVEIIFTKFTKEQEEELLKY